MLPTSSSAKGRSGAHARPNSAFPQYLRRIVKVIFSLFADLILIFDGEMYHDFAFSPVIYYVGEGLEIDRVNRGIKVKGLCVSFLFSVCFLSPG